MQTNCPLSVLPPTTPGTDFVLAVEVLSVDYTPADIYRYRFIPAYRSTSIEYSLTHYLPPKFYFFMKNYFVKFFDFYLANFIFFFKYVNNIKSFTS